MAAGYSAADDLRNKLAVKAAKAARPGVLMTGPDGEPLQTMEQATAPQGQYPGGAFPHPSVAAKPWAGRPGIQGPEGSAWTPPATPTGVPGAAATAVAPGEPGMGPPAPAGGIDKTRLDQIRVAQAKLHYDRQGLQFGGKGAQSAYGGPEGVNAALGDNWRGLRDLGKEKMLLDDANRPVQQPQSSEDIRRNREELHYQLLGIADQRRQMAAKEQDPQKRAALIADVQRMTEGANRDLPMYSGPEDPRAVAIHDRQAAAVPGQRASRDTSYEAAQQQGGINQASETFRVESMVNRAAIARANQSRELAQAQYDGNPDTIRAEGERKRIMAQTQLEQAKQIQKASDGPASPGAAVGREQRRQSGISQVYGSEGAMQQKVHDGASTLRSAVNSLDDTYADKNVGNAAREYQTKTLPDLQRYASIDPVGAAQVAREHLAEIQRHISYMPGWTTNKGIQERRQTHLAAIEAELTRIASGA